ncbi:hypothetical protein SK128_025476 [Halocaridina rubra]|uniref:Glucosylceramidase n=1 Tax=Halocaridina rubra TaxID=373956 RepID=A0AAN8WXA0_HALRR
MVSVSVLFGFWCLVVGSRGQTQETGSNPCARRDFGETSFVCVCNETYCDTLLRPTLPQKGEFLLYSSDMKDKRFLKSLHNFTEKEHVCEVLLHPYALLPNGQKSIAVDFILDPTITQQEIIGWGGALSDSAAATILSVPEVLQDMLLSSYFSEHGSEYNLIRTNMGGCDFSWRLYTHADTEGDIELATFALQSEDTDFKIPILKRIMDMAANSIKVFASPWSAPPWMKTNNDYVGIGELREDMYQVWANYFLKFVEAYAAENITMWGMTLQNQPRVCNTGTTTFNCMGWTPEQQRKWLAENLGPTLKENGYGDLKLMIMDDTRYELGRWPQVVLGDPTAKQYASGIAVHWYTDTWVSPDKLDDVHSLFPDIFILNTEACEGNFPTQPDVILGSWERGEHYARNIIENMNHWMNGWLDWNLALNMEGGPSWISNFLDSPIIVNKDAGEFYKNPMFYAKAHFSKFIKPNARKVELTKSEVLDVDAVAFKNVDGSIVMVISNRQENTVEVRVDVLGRGTMVFVVTPRSLHTVIFI